ncbi:MAG: hypothetical protein WCT32_03725 [Patescibacteria group bacterium]|jgi:NDP-sugar pyrophosphorylase family protein
MERERVTISIKKELLGKIDGIIDGVSVRNRSHAVEHLVTEALNGTGAKNAVILVGGSGALKLLPTVIESLRSLEKAGFVKVYIALGYLADKIKERLGDGSEFGLEIEYVEEGEGTGGAILPLKEVFLDTFLIINPNGKAASDISKILEFHNTNGFLVTVATNDLTEFKGVYVAEPEVFGFLPKGFSMLESDLFPKLIKEGKLAVYPLA